MWSSGEYQSMISGSGKSIASRQLKSDAVVVAKSGQV